MEKRQPFQQWCCNKLKMQELTNNQWAGNMKKKTGSQFLSKGDRGDSQMQEAGGWAQADPKSNRLNFWG